MGQALRLAFDLMHFPAQARGMRAAPLPADVTMLLHIAAGEEDAIRQAVSLSGRSPALIREAAGFFIEQSLLFPDADNYRVLATTPQASNGELRQNMALLLRWLHPDVTLQGERSVFVTRVTRAWNELKTPERRAAYDQLLRKKSGEGPRPRQKANRGERREFARAHNRNATLGQRGRSLHPYPDRHAGLLQRILVFVLGRTVH